MISEGVSFSVGMECGCFSIDSRHRHRHRVDTQT